MVPREQVPLASLTTFRIGGPATLVVRCKSIEDIKNAILLAQDRVLPWYVIGGGSNLLAADTGYDGVVLLMQMDGMTFEGSANTVTARVSAGVSWDAFVREAGQRGLWGVENLAGIPGTVGASPVQNIGAYGAEVAQTISSVEAYDASSHSLRTMTNDDCAFAYRDSIFKRDPSLIITSVTFTLSRSASPNISYADVRARQEAGALLETPTQIGEAIRDIRAQKFPDLTKEGTAGSFFKNPTITEEAFARLKERYPELPGYETPDGVKVSLAWILDKVLQLRGFTMGPVRLFERQPLVLVASSGTTSAEVDALADHVTLLVFEATGITIEREVRSLS